MSQRACEVLQQVDRIAAEDTRRSGQLLRHFAIKTPALALHEHNERQISEGLVARMQAGETIALVSDAGTPLVSDPGFYLVRLAVRAGIRVIPVPGACALTAALSVAGLATDRFRFEGFLPAKRAARQQRLETLLHEPVTLVFYEAPHRILDMLADMEQVFGGGRSLVLAREITKTFETVLRGGITEVRQQVESDANQQKGEMVVLLEGAKAEQGDDIEAQRILKILLAQLPVKQAATLASEITGEKKNRLYDLALKLGNKQGG